MRSALGSPRMVLLLLINEGRAHLSSPLGGLRLCICRGASRAGCF